MSPSNRPQASSSMSPSDRVRQLWLPFERSQIKSRSVIDHKVKALLDKADKDYGKAPPEGRLSPVQHNAFKARLAKQTLVPHFEHVRMQWEKILAESGLRAEHWTDMSAEEMTSVSNVLGNLEGDTDQNMVAVQPPAPTLATQAPPRTYATRPAQPIVVAPSLSSSTRSSNVSTASSYALVDPSEFHSEDEDFFPLIATSHDLTSDDDDAAPAHLQNYLDAWSSDSSSHHSRGAPSASSFSRPAALQNAITRKLTSASRQAAYQNEKEQPNGSKAKANRPSYVGPIVNDFNEALSDEEDFERFKMNIRIKKIVEFHQAAAQADIDLAIAIYKDRKAQNNDKQDISFKVTNHQERMLQLQMEKEEERKKIVAAERSKRRTELRRRPGRSGTLVAPIPSAPANPPWLMGFEEQVAEEVGSNLSIDKIISNNPDVQEGNVNRLLQQMFSLSSPDDDDGNFTQPFSQNGLYVANELHHPVASNGCAPASTPASQGPIPKRLLNVRNQKLKHKVKPTLFGDESSDEEEGEEEESSPPHRAASLAQPVNPFMDADAGELLSNQLMANPDFASAFAQWGTSGVEPEVPRHPVPVPPKAWGTKQFGQMDSSSSTPWNMSQVVQTPTVDNPNPWGGRDVRSTPVALVAGRRKPSFSATQTPSLQSPFLAAERPEQPKSLKLMAAYNSANVNEKKVMTSVDERKSALEEPLKGPSPPRPSPPANGFASVSALSSSTTGPTTTLTVSPPTPGNKRLNKKQRQVQKKPGTSVSSSNTDNQTMEAAPVLEVTTLEQPSLSEVPQPVNGLPRLRKDSFSGWGETVSTPRPASKIPAHLQEKFGATPRLPSQMADPQRIPSGTSTIKASQLASTSKAAIRQAWNIFSPQEVGPSKLQTTTPLLSVNRDHPYLPGSFNVEDNDNDANGVDGYNGPDGPPLHAQFSTLANTTIDKSVTHKRPSPASVPDDLTTMKAKAVTPNLHQQSAPSPIGAKKGKNKKGKKKATVEVEEIPDEEQDSRGERLPTDSRFILEEQNIHEPKPSVPPMTFESIIGYGREGEGASSSSSFATPSTAPSPPPDLFDGDPVRLAAAKKQLQEGSARVEKELRGTVWGTSSTKEAALGPSVPEAPPAFLSWGNASDRKKSAIANNNGENSAIPKSTFNPAIQKARLQQGDKLF